MTRPLVAIILVSLVSATAFYIAPTIPRLLCRQSVVCSASGGGFGGGGSGSSKKFKTSQTKRAQEQLLRKYGGDVTKGTGERINRAMSELPPHLQMATVLYKQIQLWDAHVADMSILAQASLPTQEVQGARRAREDLQRIYTEHNLDDIDIHNIFQKITWDASADAKSARAAMGSMKQDIEKRVVKACEYIAEAVKLVGASGRCLDVGCGPGTLVPYLIDAGVQPKQITGVDLSPDMIRNAQSQHRGVNFAACDFMKEFKDSYGFDGIIFCSALHDLPDSTAALAKARSLLRPDGKIVIFHAQGAAHVMGQVKTNPVMVKRGLPSAAELESLSLGLSLEVSPANPGSTLDSEIGYLAVLRDDN